VPDRPACPLPPRAADAEGGRARQARKTVRLAVAGAFHTEYMKPAEDSLRCG